MEGEADEAQAEEQSPWMMHLFSVEQTLYSALLI